MAYKALIFGTDDLFNELKPFYEREVQRGTLDIVAYAVFENNELRFVPDGSGGGQLSVGDNFFATKFLRAHETT